MTILRVAAEWSGFRGAPGYSNFYFQGQSAILEDPTAAAAAVRTFFDGIKSAIPTGVQIRFNGTADNIDEQNGNILAQVDYTPGAAISGGGGGQYSAASGAVVNWNTAAYVNGRRVRGRTFLVPLASAVYDSQGDISSAVLTTLRTAASGLVDNPGPAALVVWSRARNGSAGSAHPVTNATVPDLGAILRSRRD